MPGEVAANFHKLCNNYEAKEVLTLANSFLHSMDNETNLPQEALIAILEREDKLFSVVQQYKVDGTGKVRFGKKYYTSQNKTGPMGHFGCIA